MSKDQGCFRTHNNIASKGRGEGGTQYSENVSKNGLGMWHFLNSFVPDCSSTGIGFTLAQIQNGKEVVIPYNGRGLNKAEQNNSTTEREALALVEGVKKFQPYLHNCNFTVVTDDSSLNS